MQGALFQLEQNFPYPGRRVVTPCLTRHLLASRFRCLPSSFWTGRYSRPPVYICNVLRTPYYSWNERSRPRAQAGQAGRLG